MTEHAGDPADRHRILRDLVVGVLSVAAAVLGAISHFSQDGRLHADYGAEPGPALLPELMLAALATTGVLLILRGLLSRRAGMLPKATPLTAAPDVGVRAPRGAPTRALAALGATIVFAVLQAFIGFGIAACILGAGLSAAMGLSEGRSLPRSAAEGLAVAAILYLTFRYLLSVPLT